MLLYCCVVYIVFGLICVVTFGLVWLGLVWFVVMSMFCCVGVFGLLCSVACCVLFVVV